MDRRKKAWRELAALTPSPEEALSEDIDGTVYRGDREARCHVCSAADKALPNAGPVFVRVNTLLACGLSYSSIIRSIEPLMSEWQAKDRISYHSIRNHQRRHLPVDETIIREIVERRARKQRKTILNATEPLVTYPAVLEVVVLKGMQGIVAGEVVPKVRDVIDAAEILAELDGDTAGSVMKAIRAQFDTLVMAVRDVVPPDLWEQINARLTSGEGASSNQTPTDSTSGKEVSR